jgi:hypothetical protein
MPFPPSFDESWDITTPADTQAANLLGQDIRDLKNDIMQRLSLLAGTFANRPTPETVNADWGGSGYGLLYFATDTKRVYQWNGASWDDVTSSIGGGSNTTKDFTASDLVNTTVYTTINGVTVPAGIIAAGCVVEIISNIKVVSGGVTTLKLTDNSGATLIGATYAYVLSSAIVISRIFAASSGQILHVSEIRAYAASANGLYQTSGSAVLDLSGANTLTVLGHSGGSGEIKGYGMIVKVFN